MSAKLSTWSQHEYGCCGEYVDTHHILIATDDGEYITSAWYFNPDSATSAARYLASRYDIPDPAINFAAPTAHTEA